MIIRLYESKYGRGGNGSTVTNRLSPFGPAKWRRTSRWRGIWTGVCALRHVRYRSPMSIVMCRLHSVVLMMSVYVRWIPKIVRLGSCYGNLNLKGLLPSVFCALLVFPNLRLLLLMQCRKTGLWLCCLVLVEVRSGPQLV